MPLIKRYPNRKLYDTEAKRYVTLDEIAEMVRQGSDVRVTDHESGEDVTSLTLAQIIFEQEKKTSGFVSIPLLTNLIRTGGTTLEQWGRSLHQSVSNLGNISRLSTSGLEEQMNRMIEQGKLTVEQAQGLVKLDDLLADLLHSLNVPTHHDIQTLQGQITSLNAKLAELGDFSGGAGYTALPPPSGQQETGQVTSTVMNDPL